MPALLLTVAPSRAQPALDVEVALPMPAGISPHVVVLWSSGPLVVEHDVVISGDGTSTVVAMPAVPPRATDTLWVSAKSRAENLHSVLPITIDRAVIAGDARSAGAITLAGGAQVLGTLAEHVDIQTTAGPTIRATFPAGSLGPVVVGSNAARPLAPGRYAAVELKPGSRLTLSTGAYYLDSLKTAPDARLIVDDAGGPVKLFVRGNLELRGFQEVPSGNATTFLAVVLGTTSIVERGFTGALVAPNAPLRLGAYPTVTFTGSFFGRGLTVREHSEVHHVASPLVWRPRIPFGDSTLSARTCAPFLELDPNGALRYVANPSCPVSFCDADEQPITAPTETELNATPTTTCTAVASAATACPIDPTTVTTTCTTAADCGADELCGERCVDALCTSIELRCGQLAASCSGLASGGACSEWRECGDLRDRGTVSLASMQQQMYLQDGPQPSAYIPAGERLTPPGSYVDLDDARACGYTFLAQYPALSREESARDVTQGTPGEWQVRFEPKLEHFVELTRGDLADGSFRVGGEASLLVSATVRGVDVTPLDAVANVTANRCGVQTAVTTALFGQDVDIPEIFDGAGGGLVELVAGVAGTAPALGDACRAKRVARKRKAEIAKPALVIARQVQKFVGDFGTSTELCNRTKQLLGADGLPVDCTQLAVLTDLAVPEKWRALYHQVVEELAAAEAEVVSAHLDVSLVGFVGAGIPDYASAGVEGTLELIDTTASFEAVGALMLVSEPDPRDLAASDWAGDPIPGIPVNQVFRWVHGWAYVAHAALSVLDGAIDLVARVGVDPFEVSFRENLVEWQGASWEASLVEGDPADMRDNFGASADPIAMTRVGPSSAPAAPPASNLALEYDDDLFDPRVPSSVASACPGQN